MADNCIFCGKALTFFGGCTLTCGGADQPVCGECSEKYIREPMLQRARLALDTGRAREPEKLRAFLEEEPKRQQREQEDRARRRERQRAALTCCGQEMERLSEYELLGREVIFQTYLPTMVLFRCALCGQIKFFDVSFFEETPPGGVKEEQVTCIVCGTKHSPSLGCPACALRAAQSGWRPQPPQTPEEPKPFKPSRSRFGKKPPWER